MGRRAGRGCGGGIVRLKVGEESRRWLRLRGGVGRVASLVEGESGARGLRGLLMAYWDPIGVNGIADAQAVSAYLADVQKQRMELPATPDQLADVGEQVAGWYAVEMRG